MYVHLSSIMTRFDGESLISWAYCDPYLHLFVFVNQIKMSGSYEEFRKRDSIEQARAFNEVCFAMQLDRRFRASLR